MKQVPFYSNTPDNTHCFQAVIKMIAKNYWPDTNYSWDDLDHITEKKAGLWTWPMAGYIWLANKGLKIESSSIFDFHGFYSEGYDYFLRTFGKEIADGQYEHTDMKQGQMLAEQFVTHNGIVHKAEIPSNSNIQAKLKNGYLVVCNLNQYALNQKEGYSGHFVLIYDYDDKGLTMHDPGLPSYEARHVSYDVFGKSWAYPDGKARNLTAIMKY
ncbi:MAG: peptidase C39 family protein [bacterium]|nr:peptidase C39 family protein [bacterium]